MKFRLSKRRAAAKYIFLCVGVIFLTLVILGMPPDSFPEKAFTFTIKKDTGLSSTADLLKEKGLIRSEFLYKAVGVLLGGRHSLKAGEYLFDEPESVYAIAYRSVRGIHNLEKVRVTIPEGSSSHEIAWLILKRMPNFNAPAFLALAKPHEGYLFPDTYYFYPNATPNEVLNTLLETFDEKIKPLEERMKTFGKSPEDIIKMASIVEKEALTREDRRIVAGILWKRLDNGMALQVDYPFYYLYGMTSADLSLEDLRRDSPYNTYTNKGLPPTAVSNPGLNAIEDTLTPNNMPYWFYLSDKDGKMHYAVTLNGHVENKKMYLW